MLQTHLHNTGNYLNLVLKLTRRDVGKCLLLIRHVLNGGQGYLQHVGEAAERRPLCARGEETVSEERRASPPDCKLANL